MSTDFKSFKISEGVSVTEEVVAIIAGLAATEVEGVASLDGNIRNKTIEKAGYKKLSKGVKVIENSPEEVTINLSINVEYGKEVASVCEKVQDKVKSTIETMTGINVAKVDINISSVILENID